LYTESEYLAAVRVINQDYAMVWEINQNSPQSDLLYLSWITSYNISRQANKVSAWLARNARLLSARQVTWIFLTHHKLCFSLLVNDYNE
jgi:hypothetical protein